jgi:hypothetical protein
VIRLVYAWSTSDADSHCDEDRAYLLVDKADLVLLLALAAEVGAITIVQQREDAAAWRRNS